MEEKKNEIRFLGRNDLKVFGVTEVVIFQEHQAEVNTRMGILQITGDGLHLEKLDPETGEMAVTGRIDSLYYPENDETEKKSLFSRLFP